MSNHVLIRVDEVVRVGDEFNYLGRRYMRTKHGFLKRPGRGYVDDTLEMAGVPGLKSAPVPGASAPTQDEKDGEMVELLAEEKALYPQLVGRLQ